MEGPDCFYGPIYSTYPDYGNEAPANLGDCTFAAVADWEQIVLDIHPDATLLGYEFSQAGGTADGGLSLLDLVSYWQSNGINRVPLIGIHAYPTDQADVEKYVRLDTALLVEFQFADGQTFGQYPVSDGGHLAVVDGFTPAGPLVVTWGQTLQVTWEQWDAEAVRMLGVASSADSVVGPGFGLTAPAPSTGYQVTGCWTQYSGSSWSAVTGSHETASFNASDLVTQGPHNYWTVVSLGDNPSAAIDGITLTLYEPNGDVFDTTNVPEWSTAYDKEAFTLEYWWSDHEWFWQHPELTGQGVWMFVWSFPDGETCATRFAVN